MKTFFGLVIALFVSVSSFAQIKSASLTASGLTCSMCSKAIFKALGKVASVQSVEPDIEGSTYRITFHPNKPIVLDELKKAVQGAGFSVAGLSVTANFPQTPIGNDVHLPYGGATYHFLDVASQTIAGEKTFRIVDKDFVSDSEFRKYAAQTDMPCVKTGKMASCCTGNGGGTRVYHVTL
jgi:copper chaperone CopZ